MNKNLKFFLIGGVFGVGLLIFYEIIFFLLIPILGLHSVVFGWWPFLLVGNLDLSLEIIIILTFFIIFMIGGLLGLGYLKFKKN